MSTRSQQLDRNLSVEQTYRLADSARRKSSSSHDLRTKLGHAYTLEALEHAIRTSPPPSPKQSISKPTAQSSKRPISPPPSLPSPPEVDEYGYAYDDGEEDFGGLSLMRTQSRR